MKRFKAAHDKCATKNIVNEVLAVLGNNDGIAAVLDGASMKTTKTLKRFGWKKNQIYIPNYSDDYKKMNRRSAIVRHQTLKEFLLGCAMSIGLTYMDYMCTLRGNHECQPMEDLNILFRRKLMMDKSVLGITLSVKRGEKNKSRFINPDMGTAHRYIVDLAEECGYRAEFYPEASGMYNNGGNMYVLVFILHTT